MKINFTKKQFEVLIKMSYIGNWVVNGVRSDAKGDEQIKEYKDLEKYIFSFAKKFGMEKYVDEDGKEIYPSLELEEGDVMDFIDYYDNDTLSEELASRLAMRDFYRAYSCKEIEKMDIKERIEKDHPFLEKYWEELDEHGIERLEIVEEKND
ncbi:hypothetical protein KAI92_01985 [Candidatus Parcubacteria bacterium]|nr:hypothetical protein [Candidatus Parcubacteria bacterium]